MSGLLQRLGDWVCRQRIDRLEYRARQCRINAEESREFADDCELYADYYQARADSLKTEPHCYSNKEF